MHEVGIVTQILQSVLQNAEGHPGARVTEVFLLVGQLRAVDPQVFQFCWDTLSRDTLASDSKLSVEWVVAQGRCLNCDHIFEAKNLNFICPQCGGGHVETHCGDELILDRIMLEA